MQVRVFELPPIGTNAYLLSDSNRKEAVLIDTPQSAWQTIAPILEKEGLDLKAALLTHGHFDHTLGGEDFNRNGIPMYGHKADAALFSDVGAQLTRFGLPHLRCVLQIDHWVSEGQSIELLGRTCQIRHVPGHCPGNVLFYFPEEGKAFVGDALFAGGIGRTDLEGGDYDTLMDSIRNRIYSLPNDTEVYPGHGTTTTVGIEKQSNPFVRA
ncbi:MAG: MBL fold metallo-hydrolase [Opitutales bacterium]|nr:MBL fold metallo-hydrolase [Opitutales bacterium]